LKYQFQNDCVGALTSKANGFRFFPMLPQTSGNMFKFG